MRVLARHPAPVAALLGAACSLGFAPFGLWPLGVLAVAGLWFTWHGQPPRTAARTGFGFGAGLFLAGTYWLYTAVHVYGQAPAWLAVFLMLALVAIMASYYALLGWAAARYFPATGAWRYLLGLPAAWVLLEWLRGWLFTGFPWLELGYTQVDTPLAGLAPVAGVHGMTLVAALSAGALVLLGLGTRRQRLASLAVIAIGWGGATVLARIDWTNPAGAPIDVALVQGAIPQDLKWQEDNREATLALYRRMTTQALGTQLVVWPEAALPVLAHEATDYLAALWRDAQASGSDLVIGLLRFDFEQERFYNGMVALSDEATWYYKRRLVPFGEFFPVPKFVRRWMRLMSLPYVDMSPGADDQPPLVAAGQQWGATICYEDAYGSEQLAVLDRATLLVNVTNNAWFGDSTAPHQQLDMARIRAREAGRDLVRATSNGITAFIAADGTVTARARQFQPEVLKGRVTPRTGLTPYARTGNWAVLLLALAAVAAAAWRRRSVGRLP